MAAFSEDKYDPISLNAIWLKYCTNVNDKESMGVRLWDMCYLTLRLFYVIIKETARIFMCFPIKLWFRRCRYFSSEFNNKLVFVVPAYNDFRSLQRVIEIVSTSKDNVLVLDKREYYKAFPRLLILLKSVQSSMRLLKSISKLPAEKKNIIISNLHTLFLSPGFTYYARKIINNSTPQLVVFSNDHSYDRRILIYACEENDIKTLYVQHASVSYAFPELHTTYNFLDGLDALDKYTGEDKEMHGKVILLGAVRYDGLQKYKMSRVSYKRNCIGLAINSMDDLCLVNNFVSKLSSRLGGIRIKIRCHPAMKIKLYKQRQSARIVYTFASDEDIIDYLDSIDLQIAGDSGVHLDAILGGVPSLAYNFSSHSNFFGDNYNYVSNRIIPFVDSIEQVENYVIGAPIRADKPSVRRYDEAFGKSYAGSCSEIVADFIMGGCNFDLFIAKHKIEEVLYKDILYYALPC